MPFDRRAALGSLLFAGLGLLGCATPPRSEASELRRILVAQVARHPKLQAQDLYKLLVQSAEGSEHAMEDTVGVRLWLEREIATMGVGPTEPMIDTIAPGGRVVLVNLRPWVAAGRSTDSLLVAFVRTAALIPRDTSLLARYLAVADTLAAEGALPFSATAWRDLVDGERRGGFPAVHHSDAYVLAYHPDYRVVAGVLLP